ncbi:acyltransferase [Aureimonas sp. ME7]|uniref:acyltransferase family protein n=1 Tax=Aureimonas sp. ME7 TaxID=2744252 RepID=UPI0015FA42A3|nr:acyltransferase [Aureimonas sp. ME7]
MNRIAGFDGIRAIAAVAVVFTHTAAGFLQIGGFAVNVFFVLSGYLIIFNLHRSRRRVEERGSRPLAALADFWRKRSRRIMPAYYVVLLLSLPVAIHLEGMTLSQVAFYAAYLQNFLMARADDWLPLGHLWTLAVEQQFYLVIAPLLLFTPARRHADLLIGTLVLMLGLIVWIYLFPIITPFQLDRMPFGAILLGCAGGVMAIRPVVRVSGRAALAFFAVGTLTAMFPPWVFSGSALALIAVFVVQATACTVIVVWVARNQSSRVVSLLENRILVFFGVISYSLYLVHGAVATAFKHYWIDVEFGLGSLDLALNRLLLFPAALAVSVAIAYPVWRLFEAPFQSRGAAVRPVRAQA